ncbi:glutamine synthetase family protein [Pelagibacteraceae bacterium]|nr:glutamine synthetase family protein [Pelagibacteraceae bacterium]
MTVSSLSELKQWLESNKISEVECIFPDMAGSSKGKILPVERFVKSFEEQSLRLADSVFGQTVSGKWVYQSEVIDYVEEDLFMAPDLSTIRKIPWNKEPTAQIICDLNYPSGEPSKLAPRQVLKNIINKLSDEHLQAVVAPELEFYLCEQNLDPDLPLKTPIGKSGRRETGSRVFGIDAVNEFDKLTDDIYDYCELMNIGVDTLVHESGPSQIEINLNHGDPLALADQAFMFKRAVRQVALKHNIHATFMAKPYQGQPGSSMHIHQNLVSAKTGKNLFSDKEGNNSKEFFQFIGGLQTYLPDAMLLFAPYVNSYRRFVIDASAPINTHWGIENRTVAFRVPTSQNISRRVENRIPGSDTNPYLAIAASLACGLLGLKENIEPEKPIAGDAFERRHNIPKYLPDALKRLKVSNELSDSLGKEFVTLYTEIKQTEHDAYQNVISAWEREHLLLNV